MVGLARFVTSCLLATPSRNPSCCRRSLTTVSLASASRSSSSRSSNTNSGNRKKKFQQSFKKKQNQDQEPRRSKSKFKSSGGKPHLHNRNQKRQPKNTRTPPEVTSIPALTSINGPLPTFFSCRHGYEEPLMEEIRRAVSDNDHLQVTSPCPGLVQVLCPSDETETSQTVSSMRPIYALQSIPNCHIIRAESIGKLTSSVLQVLQLNADSSSDDISGIAQSLDQAESLSIHGLVPGMFKGQTDPIWNRRVNTIANQVQEKLASRFACARRKRRQVTEDDDGDDSSRKQDHWLLQLLLFSPEVMAVSLTKSNAPEDASFFLPWPNSKYPAGLPNVDIQDSMPSSAYRKLLEALECCSVLPPHSDDEQSTDYPIVDLGACPGGWTKALRLLGCRVLAVDRSPLRDDLMKDPFVEFVTGDAFTFQPPWAEEQTDIPSEPIPNTWMVSDVIAYPERVAELLSQWCGSKWASNMIVTAKFQGSSIPWQALEDAEAIAKKYGYQCRIQHFFNNKHEVTVMLSHPCGKGENESSAGRDAIKERWNLVSQPLLGKPTYPATLGYSLAL